MVYQVEISPTAINDIDGIFEWIRERSQSDEPAVKWLDGCYEAILTLEQLPDRCPRAPESDYIGIEIRQLLYGRRRNFRILFTIESTSTTAEGIVHIHRVMRSAQARLQDEDDLFGG